MKLLDSIRVAFQNLMCAKWRTCLCIIAVSIGISAVCIIRGLGSCATNLISQELVTIGLRGTTYYIDGPGSFTEHAIEELGEIQDIQAVSPFVVRTGFLRLRDNRYASGICGVNQKIADVFSLKLLHGRELTSADISDKNRVIILDSRTAERAYGRSNIVGKTIEVILGGISDTFTIVGIVEAQQGSLETLLGESLPSICYAPFTTLNEMKTVQTTMLAVSVDEEVSSQFRDKVSDILAEHTTVRTNVRYQNLDHYEASFISISDTISWFATGVAAISAIVAGIGVMNTMLSAIDVRTHEIGVYMALGARKKDLIRNFFMETCLTCILGGIIGAGIYTGIFLMLQQKFNNQIIIIEPMQVIFGIGIALCCGIIFGIMPAIKVSGKDPIEILKAD